MIEVNSFESFHEDDGQESGTQGGGTPDGGTSLSFRSLYSHCAIPSMNTATERSLNARVRPAIARDEPRCSMG
jgi:hypothetical protein